MVITVFSAWIQSDETVMVSYGLDFVFDHSCSDDWELHHCSLIIKIILF